MKCAVVGCNNHDHEGKFVGLLCNPCHSFISGSPLGRNSQAYRNTQTLVEDAVLDARGANVKPVGIFREDGYMGHIDLIPYQGTKLKDGDFVYTAASEAGAAF